MKVITIKKGNHYPSGTALMGIHNGMTHMLYNVMFSRECLTPPGQKDCDSDWNKLFGWSYGAHHTDSIRVGWRSRVGRIELCWYLYEGGMMRCKPFAFISVEQMTTIGISLMDDGTLSFQAGAVIHKEQWEGCKPCFGYYLRPYYGGNCSAPVDMSIVIA
jgi:hypothetical protein